MHEASRIARKLSALVDMGLERVDVSPVTTETVPVGRDSSQVTSSRPAMGTLVSVSAVARSAGRAENAIGRAFEEMDRLIGILSRFDSSSAVTALNGDGRLVGAPSELASVITHSLQYHNLSRGAFDISVEPVVDLFRANLEGQVPREPTRAEIAEALELVDSNSIEISQRQVSFKKSGMGITLDGIAKGYIVDAIAAVLNRHKIKHYLINAGGDIRTAGTRERKQPWTVAVQDPSKRGRFPDTIHLTDAAVATSGSYEVYFDRDRLFHHIVSSTSGNSPNSSTSVSVVAPTAMAADALATGVFVMEPQRGIQFIDSLPGCEGLIVDAAGMQFRSIGWKSATLINREKVES
jgi:thiamine biosynthesis lipoprotein